MGQAIDRTVVLGKRWTDNELLVLMAEVAAICYLAPAVGSLLLILVLIGVTIWVLDRWGMIQ